MTNTFDALIALFALAVLALAGAAIWHAIDLTFINPVCSVSPWGVGFSIHNWPVSANGIIG